MGSFGVRNEDDALYDMMMIIVLKMISMIILNLVLPWPLVHTQHHYWIIGEKMSLNWLCCRNS